MVPPETQTNDPFISSLELCHWLTLQVLYNFSVIVSPRGMRFSTLKLTEIGTSVGVARQ